MRRDPANHRRPRARAAALLNLALITLLVTLSPPRPDEPRVASSDRAWLAVASGRVEAKSGQIRIVAPVAARVSEVLVKAGDKVFAGEALLRLDDADAHARVAGAKAEAALRQRARNDTNASSRVAARRRAEDRVADAEQAVADAQSALDATAAAWRAGTGAPGSVDQVKLDQAKAALAQARDRLTQQQAALERLQADATMPLPTTTEGQFNIARQELTEMRALLAQRTIRAPADLTVLQVDAKAGEMAAPAASAPLMLLGDVATLRVRVALDEQNLAGIKLGQPAAVRSEAFRDQEFAGTVSFIAPIVVPGRVKSRANSSETSEAGVADVLVDLDRPESLIVGMKVDVFFPLPASQRMQPTEPAGSALRDLISDICPRCAVTR